jgi:hypothetical protein
MPPNLEEFIPGERLPDIIDVYVNEHFLYRASGRSRFAIERPIKFVRRSPQRTVLDKGTFRRDGFIGSDDGIA